MMLVQASERRKRQAEADDGEDLVQPLQDAARDARFLMLQTPGQLAQQPFGLVCVVLVPGLTERLLDARMRQGQALDGLTALVDLQRWMAAATPKVFRIALLSAFAPPTTAAAVSDRAPWRGDCRSRPGRRQCSPSPPRPGHACRRCHRRRSPPPRHGRRHADRRSG